MSNLLKSDNFGQRIYDRFPMKYREDDIDQNYALKRYLQAMGDGGFQFAIEDINGLTTLIDPDTIKAEFLPLLFRHYGLEVFNGIPEEYLRYLLPRLGEIYAMKGSLQAIDYVCTSISGIKTITTVDYDENGNPTVKVKLEMDVALGDFVPDVEQLNRILEKFIPFYCDLLTIYSYLFYETGDLETVEKDFLHILDVKNEKALIPYAKGTRYAPTLTDSIGNHLLNSTFKLNEGVYYDIDPDYTVEVVTSQYKESGVFNKSKSTQYYRGKLNNELVSIPQPDKVGEYSLVLNECIDTDEVFDSLKTNPIHDVVKFSTRDVTTDIVALPHEDETASLPRFGVGADSSVFGIGVFGKAIFNKKTDKTTEYHVDHLVTTYLETAKIGAERSSEYLKGMLNVWGMRLNDTFILNEGEDTDATSQESFALADRGVLEEKESEKQKLVLNAFKYYASLNNDSMLLNGDFYTNESNSCQGLLSEVEEDENICHCTNKETCGIIQSADETKDVGVFLNSNHCTLNSMILGLPTCYDKITQNGQTRYVYATSYGLVTL